MKHFLLFIFVVTLCANSIAQANFIAKDTVYSDENDQIIDKRIFNFKHESSLYYALRFENDSVVLDRLRFTYLFGKIENSKKSQFFKLITKRNKVDTTQLIVIHYIDTLKSIKDFPEKDKIVYNKNSNTHKHVSSHRQFIKNHSNCIKKFKKNKKANVYHFYNINNGHPENYKEYTWQKDYFKLITKMFSDSYKRFNTIIINPDGTIFCINYRKKNNISIYNDIVKNKKWDEHRTRFIKRLNSLNSL